MIRVGIRGIKMTKPLTTLSITKYLLDSYSGEPFDTNCRCIFCNTKLAATEENSHSGDCPWPVMFHEYREQEDGGDYDE